jgi:hypothetical protein
MMQLQHATNNWQLGDGEREQRLVWLVHLCMHTAAARA